MWEKLKQPVTIGFFLKLIICLNIVALVFCYKVCSINTTKDQETLDYIIELEERIDRQSKIIDFLYEDKYGTKFYE